MHDVKQQLEATQGVMSACAIWVRSVATVVFRPNVLALPDASVCIAAQVSLLRSNG